MAHRARYSSVSGVNYSLHQPQTIRFIPPDELLAVWEKDYKQMQQSMIYGDSPTFAKLIEGLAQVQTQINSLPWNH